MFEKPLFIFEMANNHQGSAAHGRRIIQELERITKKYREQFDFAVKFQYRDLDTFIHPDYKNRTDIKNVKRFLDTRLSEDEFLDLKQAVHDAGMYAVCTPFDEISARRIQAQGYDMIKIASCSFTDWPLLEEIAKTGLSVIASGAGSSLEDIDRVVSFFRHRSIPFALMHCVAEYPTPDEHLHMNQITLYKERYPGLHIGFSTHEAPDDLEPVKIAVAKGAEIFEKHVGVPTEDMALNGYSADPGQVEAWLAAARRTYEMCGAVSVRYRPSEKEQADLAALQRGVFARHDLKAGDKVSSDHIYLAFPRQPGQLSAGSLSKYAVITVAARQIKAGQPLMLGQLCMTDDREKVLLAVQKVMRILKNSGVVIPVDSTCSISHHYGIEQYEQTGVTMIECVNREYCKKILVMLPGQTHPLHLHKKKEETFIVLWGSLDITCDGSLRHVEKGESVVVERGVKHGFSSVEGCVFEEISTKHYTEDSFYDDAGQFADPRKSTVYITKEMLEGERF